MKIIQIVFVLLITLKVTAQKKQLQYIVEADRSSYYDKTINKLVYPKLKLSISKGDSVFYKNKFIFFKGLGSNIDTSVFFEIYDKSVLIITYRGSNQLSLNDPAWIKRNNICIIDLKNPHKTFLVNLRNRRLASNEYTLNLLKKSGEIFYLIKYIDFKNHSLVLKDIEGKLDTLKFNFGQPPQPLTVTD